MSTDLFIYVGAFLEIGKISVETTQTVKGCPKCKSSRGDAKFCPNCGMEITSYQVAKKVRSFADLIVHDTNSGVLDADGIDFVDLDNLIVTMGDTKVSNTVEVNHDVETLDIPTFEPSDILDVFAPVIEFLDRHGIQYTTKVAVIFYSY